MILAGKRIGEKRETEAMAMIRDDGMYVIFNIQKLNKIYIQACFRPPGCWKATSKIK